MTRPDSRPPARFGVAAVWALVVLAVVTGLSMAAFAQLMHVRKQVQIEHNRVQAEWLARSGYELAVGRLLTDPDKYAGEKLTPVPDGEVTIVVKKHPKKADVYLVECEARYQTGPALVVRKLHKALKRHPDPKGARVETLADEP